MGFTQVFLWSYLTSSINIKYSIGSNHFDLLFLNYIPAYCRTVNRGRGGELLKSWRRTRKYRKRCKRRRSERERDKGVTARCENVVAISSPVFLFFFSVPRTGGQLNGTYLQLLLQQQQ